MTEEEKAWVKKVQRLLDKCPSDRIGFYTIGDLDVQLYDRSKEAEIHQAMDDGKASDFGPAVDYCDAVFLECLRFPHNVHSTAG